MILKILIRNLIAAMNVSMISRQQFTGNIREHAIQLGCLRANICHMPKCHMHLFFLALLIDNNNKFCLGFGLPHNVYSFVNMVCLSSGI